MAFLQLCSVGSSPAAPWCYCRVLARNTSAGPMSPPINTLITKSVMVFLAQLRLQALRHQELKPVASNIVLDPFVKDAIFQHHLVTVLQKQLGPALNGHFLISFESCQHRTNDLVLNLHLPQGFSTVLWKIADDTNTGCDWRYKSLRLGDRKLC